MLHTSRVFLPYLGSVSMCIIMVYSIYYILHTHSYCKAQNSTIGNHVDEQYQSI